LRWWGYCGHIDALRDRPFEGNRDGHLEGEFVNTSASVMVPLACASKAGLCTIACCNSTRPAPAKPRRMIALIGDFLRSAAAPSPWRWCLSWSAPGATHLLCCLGFWPGQG